jgi:hypothetical protein
LPYNEDLEMVQVLKCHLCCHLLYNIHINTVAVNFEQVVTRHFKERKKWGEVRILIQMRTDVTTLQLPLAYAREIVNGFLWRFIENY